jgi:BirA family biotin operon repressor/biotin-[acetyl-CoA-carboxylase] ligase
VSAEGADRVDAARLEAALAGTGLGPVEWRASIGSTNDELARAARAGAAEGAVLGADHQTAGRGRRGRVWVDNPGAALAVSLLLRPPAGAPDAGTLPIVAGVAVARAVGPAATLAWPNDVLLDGAKVAGILVDAGSSGGPVEWAVVGVGVNVRGRPVVEAAGWPPGALDAEGPPPPRQELAVRLLSELWSAYRAWCAEGPGAALAEWEGRDALRGRELRVRAGGEDLIGTGAGLDENGRMLLIGAAGPVALDRVEAVRPA